MLFLFIVQEYFLLAFTNNIIGRRNSSFIPGIFIMSSDGLASSTALSSKSLFNTLVQTISADVP